MPQKLSAMKYIKNNKRRTSVLIVSLCLCFVVTYLTNFLLSTNTESFRALFEYTPRHIQYLEIDEESLGIDVTLNDLSNKELVTLYSERITALMAGLREREEIKEVYYAECLYSAVYPLVGSMTFEVPLVEKDDVPVILEHMEATLIEGRLPEHPGEIVLDSATIKNSDRYTLGGNFYTDTDRFQIVGIIECDTYFGCGILRPDLQRHITMIVLSEGIADFTPVLIEEGVNVRENYDVILDYKYCQKMYEEEVVTAISNSTNYVYLGITLLLFIALFIVYTTYLKDRQDEWCLYCSIGYSRKTIYFSILRELLFTFGAALLIGAVLIGISEVILYFTIVEPSGLKCRFFYPDVLFEILCTYVLLFGFLQLPVRLALWKIRTIDAIEDDLY